MYINLRPAAAVGNERHLAAVRAEHRLGIDSITIGETAQTSAIGIDQVNLRIPAEGEHDSQTAAVWAPGGRRVAALEVGQQAALAGGQILNVDHRFFVFERHVGQTAAVRAPGRRDDGFGGTQYRLRTAAVHVGHLQSRFAPFLHHEGNAAGKQALAAQQRFVGHVGDTVCHVAQLRAVHVELGGQLLFARVDGVGPERQAQHAVIELADLAVQHGAATVLQPRCGVECLRRRRQRHTGRRLQQTE